MEHLTKHQLLLLALLLSFVTSLATGIVTVSLMDQAPAGMARTITQVIQQTVAGSVPPGASSTAAVAIAVSDQVADATAAIAPSIVRLRDQATKEVKGVGLIVSATGVILSDKALVDSLGAPEAVLPDGAVVPVAVVRFQTEGNIAFLSPTVPLPENVKAIAFAPKARLGESVWSLSGTTTYTLSQGIVSRLDPAASSTADAIHTSIPNSKVMPGAPLFDATGAVLALHIMPLSTGDEADFYPVQDVQAAVPR